MCDNISCPYCVGRNIDYYECVKSGACDKKIFDIKKNINIYPCDKCEYFVNVGGYENYCTAIKCIEYDSDE